MSNSRLKEVAERALTDDELFLRSGTDFVAVCSARKRDAVTSEFAARRRETFEGEIVFLFGDASSDDFLLLEEAPRGCAAIVPVFVGERWPSGWHDASLPLRSRESGARGTLAALERILGAHDRSTVGEFVEGFEAIVEGDVERYLVSLDSNAPFRVGEVITDKDLTLTDETRGPLPSEAIDVIVRFAERGIGFSLLSSNRVDELEENFVVPVRERVGDQPQVLARVVCHCGNGAERWVFDVAESGFTLERENDLVLSDATRLYFWKLFVTGLYDYLDAHAGDCCLTPTPGEKDDLTRVETLDELEAVFASFASARASGLGAVYLDHWSCFATLEFGKASTRLRGECPSFIENRVRESLRLVTELLP